VDHSEHCDALAAEIARFSTLLEGADPQTPVPTCPPWTVGDLAAHLGEVHRRSEYLVRNVATARVPPDQMGLDHGPVGATWIDEGGARLLVTLRSGDPDLGMWAWGADQHVRFWSRRQLHETLVHRIDLELALGLDPRADPAVAADAIDEFLVNLPAASAFSPGVEELRGTGDRLAFTELDGGRCWTVRLAPAGFSLVDDREPPDAELRAGALDLLVLLYGRRSMEDTPATVRGDHRLLRFWLDHSSLE
jgi:uncharacterized protein (TIGR03083 family)